MVGHTRVAGWAGGLDGGLNKIQELVDPHVGESGHFPRHGLKVTVADWDEAPRVAVTTMETGITRGASFPTLKPPELLLAGIVTCGPVSKKMLESGGCFVSCTVTPPAGAGPLSVIVPFAVSATPTLGGDMA